MTWLPYTFNSLNIKLINNFLTEFQYSTLIVNISFILQEDKMVEKLFLIPEDFLNRYKFNRIVGKRIFDQKTALAALKRELP